MGADYYCVLGLKRSSSYLEILNAFRKIVNEYGMEKLNDNGRTNERLVAFEAYDILSDPLWRDLYDQFGEIAIKRGVFVDDEHEMKRYSYHGDIFLTYKSVYGSTNPYTHVISMFSNTEVTMEKNYKKLEIVKIPISLTLNKLFFGTVKKMYVPERDGTNCVVNLEIPKGLPVNSEIIHNLEDRRRIIFVTNDLPHADFVRNGRDLISIYNVTFKEMMSGAKCVIKTLDHKLLRVNITQMITPTYQKIVRGEGMPVFGTSNDERGDLILKFNIQMPRYLPEIFKEFCVTTSKTNTHES